MSRYSLVLFIEGADGVGKSSFTEGLIKLLRKSFYLVNSTHIIKHTAAGAAFYKEWTAGKHTDLTAALCMLGVTMGTLADIKDRQQYSDVVIVDRSQASFFAYQLSRDGIRETMLPVFELSLDSEFYTKNNIATIYLECDAAVATQRMLSSRGTLDHIEDRGIEYQNVVKATYEECFKTYPVLRPELRLNTTTLTIEEVINQGFNFVNRKMDRITK